MRLKNKIVLTNLIPASLVIFAGFFGITSTNEMLSHYDTVVEQRIPLNRALEQTRAGALRVVASTSEFGFTKAEMEAISEAVLSDTHLTDQSDNPVETSDFGAEEEVELTELGELTLNAALVQYRLYVDSFPDDKREAQYLRIEDDVEALLDISAGIINMKKTGVRGLSVIVKKEEFESIERSLLDHLDEAAEYELDLLKQDQQALGEVLNTFLINMSIVIAFAFLIAIVTGLCLSRIILNPVNKLGDLATDVSRGNLETRVDIGSDDEIGHIGNVFNDMVEQVKTTTVNLVKEKENADRANQTKSEFLANMSHELRTPMHVVLSYSELGLKNLPHSSPDKLGGYFDRIHASGKRLLRLLDDLLDLSKLEAGKMTFAFEEHDLGEILDDCIGHFDAMLKEKDQGILVHSSEINCIACVDEFKITQVFSNLLSNAVKFSPNNTQIGITFSDSQLVAGRREGDKRNIPAIRLSIVDQGAGIPDDELSAVFDKFIQSSKTRTGAGGTGLGLAISKEIVRGHFGTIMAKNTEAGGAEFIVTIPRKQNGLVS